MNTRKKKKKRKTYKVSKLNSKQSIKCRKENTINEHLTNSPCVPVALF